MSIVLWPPNYTVKKHPRAKHIKLKTSVHRGLELIVPSRFNHKDIPAVLEHNRAWIEKHLLQLSLRPQPDDILPDKIELTAMNQTWNVEYVASNEKPQLIKRPHQALVLLGKIENKKMCKKILLSWVKNQAKIYLPLQLKLMSERTQLLFEKVTIRDQQTRWGSCSRYKSINLNYKLIFFPHNVANHIMIHELCHTVHLNHSEKFWQLVANHDPDWQYHRREAKKANNFIPSWII